MKLVFQLPIIYMQSAVNKKWYAIYGANVLYPNAKKDNFKMQSNLPSPQAQKIIWTNVHRLK